MAPGNNLFTESRGLSATYERKFVDADAFGEDFDGHFAQKQFLGAAKALGCSAEDIGSAAQNKESAADSLMRLGKHEEAATLYKQNLDAMEQIWLNYKKQDSNVSLRYSNDPFLSHLNVNPLLAVAEKRDKYARCLEAQNKLPEAEEQFQQALYEWNCGRRWFGTQFQDGDYFGAQLFRNLAKVESRLGKAEKAGIHNAQAKLLMPHD